MRADRFTLPPPRNRFLYALAVALVIALGLLWRSPLLSLPAFITKYGGDALWALGVFLGLGFLLPRASTLRIALLSLAFAWSIEFLQLYHAPWIDSLRATLPGRLILGSTFNAPDLLAYSLGIGLGAALESFLKTQSVKPRWRILLPACLILGLLAAILLRHPQKDFAKNVRIQILDAAEGNVTVSNHGNTSVGVTVWYQVLTNGDWFPPKEELFSLAYDILPARRSTPGDTAGSIRYSFPEQARGKVTWRVIVLCQRNYPDTLIGQFSYFLARNVTERGKFSNTDHRGPQDRWIYSETIVPRKD